MQLLGLGGAEIPEAVIQHIRRALRNLGGHAASLGGQRQVDHATVVDAAHAGQQVLISSLSSMRVIRPVSLSSVWPNRDGVLPGLGASARMTAICVEVPPRSRKE